MALVLEDLSQRIIGACMQVHRELGPGFIERVYEEAAAIEFEQRGLVFERQKLVVIHYADLAIGEHRLDLVVEHRVVVELKARHLLEDVHLATARSYLKATGLQLALVINFARPKLEIRRVILTA